MAKAAEVERPRLPRFEGKDVKAARLKINGLSSEQDEALREGTTVYFIVEAKVKAIEHERDDKIGLIRLHKAQLSRHAPADEGYAKGVLDAAEVERKRLEAEAAGQSELDLKGEDEKGNVHNLPLGEVGNMDDAE